MADKQEKIISSERIYEGRILNLRVDHLQLADGQTVKREIVEHDGAVVIVPLDDENHVFLVRQYRAAIGRSLLELPAGGIEAGEEPIQTAERELQEEVGFFPAELRSLGMFYPVPGYSSEIIHLFLARALRPSRLQGDADEAITVERLPFSEALDRIDSGLIEDAKTIAGLLRVARLLDAEG